MKKNEDAEHSVNDFRILKLLLIMKISFFLLAINVFAISAATFGQGTKLSIDMKNATVKEVLNEIERQTELSFIYQSDLINSNKKVSVTVTEATVEEILATLFPNEKIYPEIIDNSLIVLVPERQQNQQQQMIGGTVRDASTGETLPGVNVVIEGSLVGAITDADGKFSLQMPALNAVMVFTFVGYVPQRVTYTGQQVINVELVSDLQNLEEIVVIGYGTASKRTVASATAALSNEDLAGRVTTDTRQSLQGKVSGVRVVNNSGDPGSGAKIIIRGIGSFTNAEPIYIIDGIQGGDINAIAPQNIENITILKDASTTAIYGAAAANGVVIITTKTGKAGKVIASYDGSFGVDMVYNQLQLLNAADYVSLVTDIQQTNGQAITPKLQSPGVLVDSTDWQDVMFRTGFNTTHNLNLSGGGENATYGMNVGYQNIESTVIDNTFKRYTLNAKFTEEMFKKRLKLTQNIRVKNDVSDGLVANFQNGVRMPPYTPLYDPSNLGGYGRADKTTDLNDANNPADQVYNSDFKSSRFYTDFDFTAELMIIEGFKFKTQGRYSTFSVNDYTFNLPTNQGNFQRLTADMTENFGRGTDFILENYFSYIKSFGVHDISATLGNTYDPAANTRTLSAAGSDFTSTAIENISLANTKSVTGAFVNSNSSRLSYYGRLSYAYNGRYIFNASLRRDASSKFGLNNRWGTFYGFGLAWAISDEAFFDNLSFISDMKLRASYGKLGNDNIPSFQGVSSVWRGQANNIVYSFGDGTTFSNGSTVNIIPNPDLKWEETKQLDIGFDLSMLNNKLSFVVDYFHRNNQDLLIETSLPFSTGTGLAGYQGTRWINAASMLNQGVEFAATYDKSTGDFKWNVSANITYSVNEVTALGTQGNLPINSGNFIAGVGDATRTDIGQPVSSFFGYAFDHVAASAAEVSALNASAVAASGGTKTEYMTGLKPGDRVWKDVDGNGYIDPNDRTFIGNPSPKWQYGATFNGNYKNFDLQIALTGVLGADIVNGGKYWFQGMTRPFNQTADVLRRWKQDGDVTDMPRAGQNSANNTIMSSWYVEDGAYLKVQNITLGYTLPSNILSRAFTSIRFYAIVQNVLTVTNYSGFDPEVSSSTPDDSRNFIFFNGIDLYQHPNPRMYKLGLQLNF